MKKIFSSLLLITAALSCLAQDAKYVFFFIGDGMGINLITLTEAYKAASEGKHGTTPLNFSEFPVSSVATTYSANNYVTDSAASGTALACGVKTKNGVLGLTADGEKAKSIAVLSHEAGKKVGILTNVGINHATPAAFYAHQESRDNYDLIMYDLTASGFDYFSGSGFIRNKKNRIENLDPEKECKKAGYSVVTSKDEYKAKFKKSQKMVFNTGDLELKDRLACAVDFLTKGGDDNGFFIMTEAGTIDGACHGNDIKIAVKKILELEDAVSYALEFYKAHPNETAILVTADHDTGGSALLMSKMDPTLIDCQTTYIGDITRDLKKIMKEKTPSWEETKAFLTENFGLWDKVKPGKEESAMLKEVYDKTIGRQETGNVTDDFGYNNNAVIVSEAAKVLATHVGIKWTTTSHSASMAPACYIGPRQELFGGRLDNSKFCGLLEQISIKK